MSIFANSHVNQSFSDPMNNLLLGNMEYISNANHRLMRLFSFLGVPVRQRRSSPGVRYYQVANAASRGLGTNESAGIDLSPWSDFIFGELRLAAIGSPEPRYVGDDVLGFGLPLVGGCAAPTGDRLPCLQQLASCSAAVAAGSAAGRMTAGRNSLRKLIITVRPKGIEQARLVVERRAAGRIADAGAGIEDVVDLKPHLRAAQPRMFQRNFRNIARIGEQFEGRMSSIGEKRRSSPVSVLTVVPLR